MPPYAALFFCRQCGWEAAVWSPAGAQHMRECPQGCPCELDKVIDYSGELTRGHARWDLRGTTR